LYVEQFGDPSSKDNVDLDLIRLEANWKYYLDRGAGDNALFRALFRTFRSRLAIMMTVQLFVTLCQFAAPFLVLFLIAFIREGNHERSWDGLKEGFYLALGLGASQGLAASISEHLSFWQVKTGARA